VIGVDGIGTAFGNSGTGIVDGPGQANLDIAFSKGVPLKWIRENCLLTFRAEFYNAFNHPQFANPNTQIGNAAVGTISAMLSSPSCSLCGTTARQVQLGLKVRF